MLSQQPIRRALISVSDKTGLVELAYKLQQFQIEIIATGGSAKVLDENSIPVTRVADFTGFPEIMGGRVKTLHPKIQGGLLARRGIDEAAMLEHHIQSIDLLIVNLYPFKETSLSPTSDFEKIIENIDVGGPTMLRAAAKNFSHVTVLSDPGDYALVLDEMTQFQGSTTLSTRKYLAQKVFGYLSDYDKTIASFLDDSKKNNLFPQFFQPPFSKKMDLRYGENNHQKAALYQWDDSPSPMQIHLLQGKPLSYNNLLDSDCALQCVMAFSNLPACVIVKHATPCGVAIGNTQQEAYQKALVTDAESAFGGIIAFNTIVNFETANCLLKQPFVEVITAPDFTAEARHLFQQKPHLRLLTFTHYNPPSLVLRSIAQGILIQTGDDNTADNQFKDFKVVSKKSPTTKEWQDLNFAWLVVKYVKSNAIVCAKDNATLGIGSGQTSRIFALEIAIQKALKAKLALPHAVMASDAFFPFADSIELAAKIGISAIIQPGGSIRDKEVIQAADEAGIAMVFTSIRHFRH